MKVRVLSFGVLKDWLGSSESLLDLPDGATVAQLLDTLVQGRSTPLLHGLAVSVNAEFSSASHRLNEGDEVGLLPPVSGGADSSCYTALTRDPIDANSLIAAAKADEDGAVVAFDGIVRNHTRNRQTLFLDYEAYEQMASRQMAALAAHARGNFGVRHVSVVHRLGRLQVGETSVFIVVASAHRAQAFDACRWLIDTVKKTVPIWKKETFADGAVWATGEPFPRNLAIHNVRK